MKVQAAVYGITQFDFLAYGVNELDEIILTMMLGEMTGEAPRGVGFYKNGLSFGNQGKFFVDLDLQVLSRNIPTRMQAYTPRLIKKEPTYLFASISKSNKNVLKTVFGYFDFPPILVDSETEYQTFKEKFPDILAAVRSNTEEIENKGRALLFGNVPEQGNYF